jgi:transcriptional regulator with XRE-family HTH domain
VCDDFYPGTREGVILVSKATPKSATKPATNGRHNGEHNGDSRRAELADFLRNRRGELKPEDVGLPNGGRRRTPGLRREEVAQLAGVGATWYTWLEQGRDIRASVSVLEALAEALQLSPAERSHLIMLGRGEEVELPDPPCERVSPTIERLIHNLRVPAVLLGRRWDYLAWNRASEAVMGVPQPIPDGKPNQMWSILMDRGRRKMYARSDWEEAARNAVARFRADSARHLGDPAFEELIELLKRESPEFAEWWPRHEVARSGEGRKVLRHPKAGKLVFEHAVFKREEQLEQRLVLYSPLPDADTPAKLERLLADASS